MAVRNQLAAVAFFVVLYSRRTGSFRSLRKEGVRRHHAATAPFARCRRRSHERETTVMPHSRIHLCIPQGKSWQLPTHTLAGRRGGWTETQKTTENAFCKQCFFKKHACTGGDVQELRVSLRLASRGRDASKGMVKFTVTSGILRL